MTFVTSVGVGKHSGDRVKNSKMFHLGRFPVRQSQPSFWRCFVKKALLTVLYFGVITLLAMTLSWGCAGQSNSPWAVVSQDPSASTPIPRPHSMHTPQHGGIFFMAMDYKHHLEGVLLAPGIFKVYLYDVYTKPLPEDKVREASGTLQIGDAADAPILPLVVAKDHRTLQVELSKDVKLPVTLTLALRFPDSQSGARPEVFTFPFDHFCGD